MGRFWEDRYKKKGIRTVGQIGFDDQKFLRISEKVATVIRTKINPLFIDKVVLDFGCGFGRNCKTLLEAAQTVYGIDTSEWAIRRAEEYEPKACYERWDGLSGMPFRDHFFEGVLSWTVLQHIPPDEIEKATREIQRVMAPGGILALYENTSTWLLSKEHVWFRDPLDYDAFFKQCKREGPSELFINFDEAPEAENHTLMIFRKEGGDASQL